MPFASTIPRSKPRVNLIANKAQKPAIVVSALPETVSSVFLRARPIASNSVPPSLSSLL